MAILTLNLLGILIVEEAERAVLLGLVAYLMHLVAGDVLCLVACLVELVHDLLLDLVFVVLFHGGRVHAFPYVLAH